MPFLARMAISELLIDIIYANWDFKEITEEKRAFFPAEINLWNDSKHFRQQLNVIININVLSM